MAVFKGLTSKWRDGKGRKGKGRGRKIKG